MRSFILKYEYEFWGSSRRPILKIVRGELSEAGTPDIAKWLVEASSRTVPRTNEVLQACIQIGSAKESGQTGQPSSDNRILKSTQV